MPQHDLPTQGVYTDRKTIKLERDPDEVLENIWRIGGKRGWYKATILWQIRGLLDELLGGPGLRRGRLHPTELNPGDPLDFWRVLVADKQNRHLLLRAEMKVPGEAWLQFRIYHNKSTYYIEQLAVYRPDGTLGKFYWLTMLPFHFIIFKGMIRNIASYKINIKR